MSASHTVHYMDELETLRVSTELFLKNLSQEEVLSVTGERAVQISQAAYCEIFIRAPDDREFVSTIRQARGDIPDGAPPVSRQLAMEAVEKQHPLICPPIAAPENGLQSWLVFPFKVMGNIVGVLCLARPEADAFSPYTVKLLSIFVDHASIAISNAQLFEDVSRTYAKLARSREAILQTSNTLQTLFDGVSDGLYIIDRDFRIITVNRAEQERLAAPQSDILRQSFLELGWGEEAPEFLEVIRRTFQSGQTACWIPPASADSPLLKNRQMHLYPIITPQKTIEQVIIFAQDITEQRRLQASLFESANLAAVGQLATSVAHEINNPLTVALTNTQLLMMELDEAHPWRELIEDIYQANARIGEIIANLVDLARQDVYRFEPLGLIETLEDALSLIAHPLRRAKVTVERRYFSRPIVVASRGQLKLAWMNLLLNACDAIAAAGKRGVVTLTVQETPPAHITVAIADDGVGIPAEYADHVFHPFFTTKRAGKSVGLGLFMVYKIIEKHGGRIAFESTPGATCFTITLPQNGPHANL